jgi:hypothetical protein
MLRQRSHKHVRTTKLILFWRTCYRAVQMLDARCTAGPLKCKVHLALLTSIVTQGT